MNNLPYEGVGYLHEWIDYTIPVHRLEEQPSNPLPPEAKFVLSISYICCLSQFLKKHIQYLDQIITNDRQKSNYKKAKRHLVISVLRKPDYTNKTYC